MDIVIIALIALVVVLVVLGAKRVPQGMEYTLSLIHI